MKTQKIRPAHILRMCNRLSKIYPDLDFTNIVTISEDLLQTRFDNPNIAGCHVRGTDEIFIGLGSARCDVFAHVEYAWTANVLLHEVIHRKQSMIDPWSKAHGKLFQELCLKYGLDPRIEIAHDKDQELIVDVPYEITAFHTAGGLHTSDDRDCPDREDVAEDVFYASRSIAKRKGKDEDWNLDYTTEVYRHKFYQHYPAYRICDHIVSGYHATKVR